MKKSLLIKLILGSAVLVSLFFFQNCAQKPFEAMSFASTEATLETPEPADHPPTEPLVDTTQKTWVVNRTYVAELFRDIFDSHETRRIVGLEAMIDELVMDRGAQLGGACNPYDTYSGTDCGGAITNATGATLQEGSTLRETYRVQLCENVIGIDDAVKNAVESTGYNTSVPPVPEAIQHVYALFYRTKDLTRYEKSLIEYLDQGLAAQGEPALERWRGMLLYICESPDWQLL